MWQKIKNIYHLFIAFLANIWYGFPSKKLIVVGVTGTDGKTTTVHLIYHILKTAGKECLPAGRQVSMISSIGAVINGKDYNLPFHVTTPSSWRLQRFLQKVARGPVAGFPPASARSRVFLRTNSLRAVGSPSSRTTPRFLVLEVTSHALDQYRVWGIDFAVGVLTNVTHEHLDYHKTYENYVATKAKLLKMAKVAVVNRDDDSYEILDSKYKIAKIHSKDSRWVTYGLKNNADINPKRFPFKTKLVGEFNQYNILAAVAACRALGVTDEDIRKAIASFELPIGRMEIVYPSASSGQVNFKVMIDFAHTSNALEQVLSAVRPTVKGRLIHVFGSAGKRDRQKRPKMGEVSAKYADVIILTAEDPRSESVDKIMSEIEAGIMNYKSRIKKNTLFEISDRQEAINSAVKMAERKDLVLITGKGHERSMNYGKGEKPWSEHQAVLNALQIRSTKHEIRNKF